MRCLKDLDLKGKPVFLRVDFNVPLDENCKITDDTRIKAVLPTLNYLINNKCKIILASHLGRPKGKCNPKLSLKPVAERLSELIVPEVILASGVIGEHVEKLKVDLKENQVLLLENLRFHEEETRNDEDFARKLAHGVDSYVNDAFGACHRKHASVMAITHYVENSAAGFLVEKEIKYLDEVIHFPQKPYVVILGGVKVSDKIPVIENLLNKASDILIGGAMAYTFLKSQDFNVGLSLVEEDKKETAINILNMAKKKGVNFYLPEDHIIASELSSEAAESTIENSPIPSDFMALDIGPRTAKKYSDIIAKAKTIFWNGPMGVFEIEKFSHGTVKIAEAIARSEALSIVGGGDTIAAIYKTGVSEKISHISTGGGAALEYVAKETLPGIEALKEK